MTVRYVAQPGDEMYTIPNAGAFGFAFSRGTDPSGATLPVAVVQRTFYDGETRIFQLRSAAAFDIVNAVYVCFTPMTVKSVNTRWALETMPRVTEEERA